MFNEAFWFFYLIGLVYTLTNVLIVFAVIAGFGTAISLAIYFVEEVDAARPWIKRFAIPGIILLLTTVMIPTQQALYAGGAQYAVEAVELDDTILAFKDIIDAKIANLTTVTITTGE